MIIDEINDLLDLKVLLSDEVSIFNNNKAYPITDVKIQAYSIHLIADSEADKEDHLSGKQIIDKIYDIFRQYPSIGRFDNICLIIKQGSIGYFNKPYGSKEILTIKSNENQDVRKYTTILYKIKSMDTYK